MTRVRLRYLHCFRDRNGRARYYFRYRDQRWPIPAPGATGFATAYDALLAQIAANPFRGRHNIEFMPGSLAWAIEKFLASPLYNERAKTTKVNYRRLLDQLRDGFHRALAVNRKASPVGSKYLCCSPEVWPSFPLSIGWRGRRLSEAERKRYARSEVYGS